MDEYNLMDIGAAGYTFWGMRKGYARGFAKTVRRLVDLATGCLSGFACYKGLGAKANEILSLAPTMAEPASFLLSFGGAFAIVRFVRRKLRLFIMSRIHKLDHLYGALLGLGRNAILSTAGIFTAGVGPNGTLEAASREGSLIGRTLFALLGG